MQKGAVNRPQQERDRASAKKSFIQLIAKKIYNTYNYIICNIHNLISNKENHDRIHLNPSTLNELFFISSK